MGVCLVAVVVLSFGLIVGWRWYFGELANRQAIMELSAKEESRAAALGLGSPLYQADRQMRGAPEDVVPLSQGVALTRIAPGERDSRKEDSVIPDSSVIEELPIAEIQADVTAAQALLKRYWATAKWEDRLPLVREPDRVKPLMQTFYESQMGTDPLPGSQLGVARFRIDGLEVIHFTFESSRPSVVLEVAMLRDSSGVFRIDWESCVGYCDKTFVQLRLQRPTEPVLLRTVVQLDDYYNFEFDDPQKFICVKMISPSGGYSLFGYAKRSGEIGEWLERELAGQGVSRGLTVLVAYPPKAQSDQCVAIQAILADRWLTLP